MIINVDLGKAQSFATLWLHLTQSMIHLTTNPVALRTICTEFVLLSEIHINTKAKLELYPHMFVLKSQSLFVFPVRKCLSFSGGSLSGGSLISPFEQQRENLAVANEPLVFSPLNISAPHLLHAYVILPIFS